MKNIVIISTSLRPNSNSDQLAKAFERGARENNDVTYLSLKDKSVAFCRGCLACQQTGSCIIKDDAVEIEKIVLSSDVVVFATPVYYYGMSGQMKTLLDRLNPMYSKEYKFRDVYLLTTAAENEEETPKRAIDGLQGWLDCFEKAELKGTLFCGGVNAPKDIDGNEAIELAYQMGKQA